MPSICCAVSCDNSKSQRNDKKLKFYNIPKNPERRQKWISAIKRDHWTPTEHSRLCSEHFISGTKSDNPLNPNYVPSLFAYLSPEERQRKINCYKKFEQTQAVKRKRSCTSDVSMLPHGKYTGNEMDHSDSFPECGQSGEHSYCKDPIHTESSVACSDEACRETVKKLTEECTRLRAEVYQLRDRVSKLSFQQEVFKDNDEMVQDLTGLPSYSKMMVVFTFLSGFLKGGPGLTPFHCFLMTLMRMRLDLPLHFFTYIFHVSKPTVSRIFNSTLNVMNSRLSSSFIVWPSKEQIQISLPMCFKNSIYRNCTSIIDCFEIFIEKPKNMKARAQTYSQYKHHNTVKYLISITPQGVISFVSTGWGGRTSDKHLTENCGYLENLSPGDVVLADRGFTIGDAVSLYSAHLKLPAFTKGKQQLHPSELESTRGLAAVRIHVERVIGLVRNKYTILQSTIPISLCQTTTPGELTSLDKMVRVCCALCNICPSVVPSE
ncbi:uncharacterized protein LOC143733085 [Siphateles boraxobius]|uniref:uncharacterized protein LOC143733085 n=1 Tax=Siphateles boraxobius TaxID=180520 RepID=UPI0040631397